MFDEQSEAITNIERCRSIHRKAADALAAKGVILVDNTLGAMYATHDIATVFLHGDQQAAIEYLRASLDHIERQIADQVKGYRH